jgi:glycosyltransferase involved in cell wall biosynthesis
MRIGIDACCWSNKRGYGRFTRELLTALLEEDRSNEYLFFLDRQTAARSDLPKNIKKIVVPTSEAPTEAASAYGHRSLRDLLAMSRAVAGQKLDVFFFPSVYTYYPLLRRVRTIVGIHDAVSERYPALLFPSRRSRWLWRSKLKWALKHSDLILTVSQHAERDIIKHFGLSKAQVRVVPEAAAPCFHPLVDAAARSDALARYHLSQEQRLLLYVGGLNPHKNLDTLIKVYAKLIQDPRFGDVMLAIVGDKEDVFFSNYAALQSMVDHMNLNKSVVFTGFVPDADLVSLYNAAEALVLPSFDEGFGLPAVEAMACGTPVLASATGSLPEVVGDAGILFDPHNPREMQEALSSVLMDAPLREKMRRLGLRRAAEYSWQHSARALVAIFNSLAQGK